MRPASRRALLKRLTEVAPHGGVPLWSLLVVVAAVVFLISRFFVGSEKLPIAKAPEVRSPPLLDPVLALPFGEGNASAHASAQNVPLDVRRVDELRVAYRNADDRQALYKEWRDRPEADARYLAFRAARDCDLVRAGGIVAELDVSSERKGEQDRQLTLATTRCRGFMTEPAPPDEVQRLEQEAASAGHPAAQIALAAEAYVLNPRTETLNVLRRGLSTGDPLAFDEARVLLAMSRHQYEIAGVPPTAADGRSSDARVAAIDLVGCRLGNPCGPSRGLIAIDCGASAVCLRDAEELVLQSSELSDEERRTALALADRMLAAFKRGAVDEIVRAPGNPPTRQ